jgi:ABC-type nitrate/sulfonate/bicarbonate transport system ATPase subunit
MSRTGRFSRRIVLGTGLGVGLPLRKAVYLGDRAIVMQPNPGRIAEMVSISGHEFRDRADPSLVHRLQEILGLLGVAQPHR